MNSSNAERIFFRLGLCLLAAGLACGRAQGEAGQQETSRATAEVEQQKSPTPTVKVTGRVVDADGAGVAGIEVESSFEYSPPFWFPHAKAATDAKGLYDLRVPAGYACRVIADDIKISRAESEHFNTKAGQDHRAEDLVVRLRTASVEGTILLASGAPAANLHYQYSSGPWIRDLKDYPHTDSEGAFRIDYLFPDEPFALWAVLTTGTAQIWRDLAPGSTDLELRLDPGKYVDLPPGWEGYRYLHDLAARKRTFAQDDRVAFSLPDLEGNLVSLQDEQFRGKVVVLTLWGTWCGPCTVEIPYLVGLKEKYKDQGLEVVAVDFERGNAEQQLAAVTRFLSLKPVNYPILLGGAADYPNVASKIPVIRNFRGYPTTIYIGRDGLVKDIQVAFFSGTPELLAWTKRKMEKQVEALLRAPAGLEEE